MPFSIKKPKLFQDKPIPRDDEDRVIIDMTVRDDSDFLSPFSATDSPVIEASVAEYIENRTAVYSPKEKFHLCIHSDCIDEKEKPVYEGAIKTYFAERLTTVKREEKRNLVLAIILALTGIAVLTTMLILGAHLEDGVWTEVVDIVAWVFLWEATDLYFLENRHLRLQTRLYRALSYMKIDFLPS